MTVLLQHVHSAKSATSPENTNEEQEKVESHELLHKFADRLSTRNSKKLSDPVGLKRLKEMKQF